MKLNPSFILRRQFHHKVISSALASLFCCKTDLVKKKIVLNFFSTIFLCEQWDLNPHVINTRPSNVPVCQFQHARLSRQQKELYHLCGGLSTYFLKNFVFFYTLLNSYKTAKNKAIYIIKIHKGNKSILMIFIPLINKF